jgi:hypothetical protein
LITLFSGMLLREQTVISTRHRSSRPHQSVLPRPQLDAQSRYMVYGPIQPMEQPGFLKRIFGKR